MRDHTCDRKRKTAKVIDDPDGDQEITRIFPTCSFCGVPQVFEHGPNHVALASLHGRDIGTARNALPPCRADSPDEMTGAVETAELGLVRITFAKTRAAHHRSRSWFWVPDRAERG